MDANLEPKVQPVRFWRTVSHALLGSATESRGPRPFASGSGAAGAPAAGFGEAANPQRPNGIAAEPLRFSRDDLWAHGKEPCAVLPQSSPVIITVMAGAGSSMSTGPQVAINLTSLAWRLSLRT